MNKQQRRGRRREFNRGSGSTGISPNSAINFCAQKGLYLASKKRIRNKIDIPVVPVMDAFSTVSESSPLRPVLPERPVEPAAGGRGGPGWAGRGCD